MVLSKVQTQKLLGYVCGSEQGSNAKAWLNRLLVPAGRSVRVGGGRLMRLLVTRF